ncbi:MAG: trigger factor [Ruminococcaceae bacterium]|nr:trigger factor [Oscillospiraceae bacterium]
MEFKYRGLTGKLEHHTVTDEEIDRQIERLRQQNPRVAHVTDRPTQLGDEVVLDYKGFCNGEQFPGGSADYQTLTLGSGQFIPGFEEQLVDKVPGEEITVKVTFPKEYHASDLAGKDAEFICTIHEIRVNTPYELDDVFAQEVGQCPTFRDMRELMGKSMQAYADDTAEMELQDSLIRQAAETLEYTCTEAELNEAIEEQMQTLSAQLAQKGLNLEMYCQFMNTTEAELREQAKPAAEKNARIKAAIEKIVELEKLEPTQEETEKAIELVCRQNRMSREQLQPYMDEEFNAAIRRSVLTTKALSLVRDAATIETC